jgi:hypothetical protein
VTVVKEKVVPILERLPVLDAQRQHLDWNADMIVMAFVVSRTGDIPRRQLGGTAKAQRMLAKLRDSLNEVAICINTMPLEAHEALDKQIAIARDRCKENEARGMYSWRDRVYNQLIFDDLALTMARCSEAARLSIAECPVQTSARKPRKNAAAAVTRRARDAYELLTGKRATVSTDAMQDGHPASGQFLELISELFEVLGIRASAEAQVRAALKEKRAPKEAT